MTIKQAMSSWVGEKSSSYLKEDNFTGLKLITDEASILLDKNYIHHPQDISNESPKNRQFFSDLIGDYEDEQSDYGKYMHRAQQAKDMGRDDLAVLLEMIAHEEANHRDVLEAVIPSWMNKNVGHEAYETEEFDLERRLTGGPYDAGEREAHIHNIALELETHVSGNTYSVTQEQVDAQMLIDYPGEVFTSGEHAAILTLVNLIHQGNDPKNRWHMENGVMVDESGNRV